MYVQDACKTSIQVKINKIGEKRLFSKIRTNIQVIVPYGTKNQIRQKSNSASERWFEGMYDKEINKLAQRLPKAKESNN